MVPLLLGGCAAYHARPLTLAQSAAAIARGSLADPALRRYLVAHQDPPRHWPKRRWTLRDLTLVGLFDSPALEIARARVRQRAGSLRTARELPNPTANVFGQHHSLAQSVSQTAAAPWTLGFSVVAPLLNPDLRRASMARAGYRLQAAQLGLGTAVWTERRAVRQAYVASIAAARVEVLARRTLALRTQRVALVRARLAAGEGGRPALRAAEAAQAGAKAALATARAQRSGARARLAGVLGLPPSALSRVRLASRSLGSDATPLPDPAAMQSMALLNRLDLRQALFEYDASEQALRIAIDRQYPQFQVGPGYSWDEGDRRWSLGVSLTLPLFNRNGGAIERARARRQLAALHVRALQERVLAEAAADTAAYRASRARVARAKDVAQLAQAALGATRQAFAAGDVGRMTLTQARLAGLRAQRGLLDAEMARVGALGRLEDVLQRPLVGARAPASESKGVGSW